MKKVNAMYFSPTSTSKKIVEEIRDRLLEKKDIVKGLTIDFTLAKERELEVVFKEDDLLIIGLPVYAGRVPNVLVNYLNTIKGLNTKAIPIVLYGNRDYDDALIELNDILIKNGFIVIGAASFIGEHSFSKTLAKGRPDNADLSIARNFADNVYKNIGEDKIQRDLKIKGNRPYRKHYMPKDKDDKSVDIRKVEPKTRDTCIDCKICAEVCPMASIDYVDVSKLNGICIKCGACIKKCPTDSKYFDDTDYLRHKKELEDEFKIRKEPEMFL